MCHFFNLYCTLASKIKLHYDFAWCLEINKLLARSVLLDASFGVFSLLPSEHEMRPASFRTKPEFQSPLHLNRDYFRSIFQFLTPIFLFVELLLSLEASASLMLV